MAAAVPPRRHAGAEADALRGVVRGLRLNPLLIFAVIFTALFLLHAPLLRLPYFWDEAGYDVPAARDLLLTGSLIPHSPAGHAHPPLTLAWLALWWKLSGYTPAVARTAMLLVAVFALLAVFRLARKVANLRVAVAATAATALYPVFFAQSSMAHADLAAAAILLWAIVFHVEHSRVRAAVTFCLAVLAKETAVVVPMAIGLWELWWWVQRRRGRASRFASPPARLLASCVLALAPVVTLAAWLYVFRNPDFGATLQPLRMVLALGKRLWQITAYMNLFLLTAAAAMAMAFPPQPDGDTPSERIALDVQALFAVVIAAQVVLGSLAGGAAPARDLLTSLALVVIVCVSTIWRRMRQWPVIIGIVAAGFVLAWFVNPPYPFALEDNLAYRDYVLLHQRAASLIAAHHARERVLTAWPATDELSHPYLGYTKVAVPKDVPALAAVDRHGRTHAHHGIAIRGLLFAWRFLTKDSINEIHAGVNHNGGATDDDPPLVVLIIVVGATLIDVSPAAVLLGLARRQSTITPASFLSAAPSRWSAITVAVHAVLVSVAVLPAVIVVGTLVRVRVPFSLALVLVFVRAQGGREQA